MNESAQLELTSTPPATPADKDVAWLENLLRGGKVWMTASDILLSLGRPKSDVNTRWLRDLASQSAWIISGQKGYRHIEHSTPEEINHAANWLESQGKLMGERAGRIRSSAHKIFG